MFAILGRESRDVPQLFELQMNAKINNVWEFGDHNPVGGIRCLNANMTLIWFGNSSFISYRNWSKKSGWKISKQDREFLKTVVDPVNKRDDTLLVGKKSIKMELYSWEEFDKEFVLFVH